MLQAQQILVRVAIKPEKIIFSENLHRLFPKVEEIFNEPKMETN